MSLLRWVQVLGGAVGVAILAANLRKAWTELHRFDASFSWPLAALATLLLVLTYGGLAWLWRAVAKELRVAIPYRTAVQFWAFSNLGRYVPGKVWQIAGVMMVASDLGVPPGLAAAVGVFALGFMVATGALLGVSLLPRAFASDGLRIGVATCSAAMLALPIVWPSLVSAGLRRLPRALGCGDVVAPTRAGMLRMTAYFLAMWTLHGAVFHVFCMAFVPLARTALPSVTGAFCVAYVSGLVAVFAPGGIGVREEVLGAALASVIPEGPVHVLAISARLWTMVAEVAVLCVALALRLRAGRIAR